MTGHAFQPWRENYKHANIIGLLALLWLCAGLLWCAVQPTILAISFAMLPSIIAYFFFVHREKGNKRKYGLILEKSAVEELIQSLPEGWIGQADVKLPNSNANTDCYVITPYGQKFVIEVKSWHYLTVRDGALTRKNSDGKIIDETKKLSGQIWHQIISLKANHGFIWLYNADYRTPIVLNGFYVVYGRVKRLRELLISLNVENTEYTIRFPTAPNEAMRATLKTTGFRWNAATYSWALLLPAYLTLPQSLVADIKTAGGCITPEIEFVPPPLMPASINEQFTMLVEQIV